jgi:hypothetical protein
VFPGKTSAEALNRSPLAAAPRERAKWQSGAAKNFFKNLNFLLAIFGPIVHSRKKLQGLHEEKLARCP